MSDFAGAVPLKSTTLYVGRVPTSLEDAELQQLLTACGEVQLWKPTVDPDSQAFKGFGFCTYTDAAGVSTALAVLHDLSVDGQNLIVKTNKVRLGAGGRVCWGGRRRTCSA